MSKTKKDKLLVCRDHQGRTCIKVDEDEMGLVKYIPLSISDGFQVQETSIASFNQRYKAMPNYPVARGCQLYLNYSLNVGATDEALDYLSQMVTISESDRETARAKQCSRTVVKSMTTGKAPGGTKSKSTPKKKVVKKTSGKYSSASQMFQDLIMEGTLTDDEIFQQVQVAFDLDDKKRSYVKWYRNNLIKKGMTPPEAK